MLKYFFTLFCCLISSVAYSKNLTVPTDLLYDGQPIDSACFNVEGNSNEISLKQCGKKNEKKGLTNLDNDLIKKGYIGYNWSEGSTYYKIFPAENHQYWIYSANNTGGSGMFTAISLVKRIQPDKLTIKTIASGDRSNGGISDARGSGNQLDFDVNLTPFDLFALANNNPHQLKAYDDLAACAVCYAGTATYRVNAKSNPKLLYVTLDTPNNTDEMPIQGKYQLCFNKILVQYAKSGKTKLDESQLKQLAKEFNEKCYK